MFNWLQSLGNGISGAVHGVENYFHPQQPSRPAPQPSRPIQVPHPAPQLNIGNFVHGLQNYLGNGINHIVHNPLNTAEDISQAIVNNTPLKLIAQPIENINRIQAQSPQIQQKIQHTLDSAKRDINNIPQLNLQLPQTHNPVLDFLGSIPTGIINSTVNAPRNIAAGGTNYAGDLLSQGTNHPAGVTQAISHIAQTELPIFDVASNFAGGKVAKDLAEQGLKSVAEQGGKQTLKDLLKKGAQEGFVQGGQYGLAHGALSSAAESNAQNTGQLSVQALQRALQEGVPDAALGGLFGAGASGLGYGVNKLVNSDAAKAIGSQIANAASPKLRSGQIKLGALVPGSGGRDSMTLKDLEAANRSTYPKVPSTNVFYNGVDRAPSDVVEKADKFIDAPIPDSQVPVNKIVPTQKSVNLNNLKDVQGVTDAKDKVTLYQHGDKYYVADGHHRIANSILNGDSSIKAKVITPDIYDPKYNRDTAGKFVPKPKAGKIDMAPEDQNTLIDFLDHATGAKNLSNEDAIALENETKRIATKYNIPGYEGDSNKFIKTVGDTLDNNVVQPFRPAAPSSEPVLSPGLQQVPKPSGGIIDKMKAALKPQMRDGKAQVGLLTGHPELPSEADKALSQMTDEAAQALTDYKKQTGGVDLVPGEGDNKIRSSSNPKWYRDFYKQNGRAPNKGEVRQIAQDMLEHKDPTLEHLGIDTELYHATKQMAQEAPTVAPKLKVTGKLNDTAPAELARAEAKGGTIADRQVEKTVGEVLGQNPQNGKLKLAAVKEGNYNQAVLNAKAVAENVQAQGAKALEDIAKLSPNDHKLMDALRTNSPEELASKAENPAAFRQAADSVKKYNDYTQAAGSQLGQKVGYRLNYGAPLKFDLSTPEAQATYDNATKANLKYNPGYGKQRLLQDYEQGAQLGLQRKNANFAADLRDDIATRTNDLRQLTLAQELNRALPGKVKVGEIGSTPEGTYSQLRIAGGNKISVPKDIADKINHRAFTETQNPVLKLYDKANAGLKYLKLGLGGFHAFTEAGSFLGQQLASGKLLTHPQDSAKLFTTLFSKKAMAKETDRLASSGVLDKAHLSGLTTAAHDILSDVDVSLKGKISKWTGIKAVHDAVFQREIPYAKLKTFEQNTKGLSIDNPDDVLKMRNIAKEINQNYGGINRAVEGMTPNELRVASRLLLATDFTEGKVRTILDAVSKGGTEGKLARQVIIGKALVFGGVAAAGGALGGEYQGMDSSQVTKNLLSKLINPTFKFGNYTVKTPSTHVSEVVNAVTPYSQNKGAPWNASGLLHYATSHTAALPSEITQLASNKDYYGQPIYGKETKKNGGGQISPVQAGENALNTVSPIAVGQAADAANGKQSLGAAFANVLGFNARPTAAVHPQTAKVDTSTPVGTYQAALDKYSKDKAANKITPIEDIKRQEALQTLKTESQFDKNTNDLYDLSKSDIYKYVSTNPNGQAALNKLIQLDQAKVADGAKSKLFDSKGNLSIAPKAPKTAKAKVAKAPKAHLAKFKTSVSIKKPKTIRIASAKRSVPKLKSIKPKKARLVLA